MDVQHMDDSKIIVLETPFNKVSRKSDHIIILDKDDAQTVIISVMELDSIYDKIHAED